MKPRDNIDHLFPVQELFIRQQQELCIARDALNVNGGDNRKPFILGALRWMKFFPKRIVM